MKKETSWFEQLPLSCYQARGVVANGRCIKSLVFMTDLAIIRSCDADAVFAIYPFTPQSAISHALINGSCIPVFCGCNGGMTKGFRMLSLAQDAEGQGAMGIVPNAPISNLNLLIVTKVVDIPVIITVVSEEADIAVRLASGVSILNVAAGPGTAVPVRKIHRDSPEVPIIASGGNTEESIQVTIATGANAITFTPPSTAELLKSMMTRYRESQQNCSAILY